MLALFYSFEFHCVFHVFSHFLVIFWIIIFFVLAGTFYFFQLQLAERIFPCIFHLSIRREFFAPFSGGLQQTVLIFFSRGFKFFSGNLTLFDSSYPRHHVGCSGSLFLVFPFAHMLISDSNLFSDPSGRFPVLPAHHRLPLLLLLLLCLRYDV